MDESILDADILSEVLKRKDLSVLANAGRYLGEHQRFAFSERLRSWGRAFKFKNWPLSGHSRKRCGPG